MTGFASQWVSMLMCHIELCFSNVYLIHLFIFIAKLDFTTFLCARATVNLFTLIAKLEITHFSYCSLQGTYK